MVSQAELISKGYHSLVPCLISILLEMVWVPLSKISINIDNPNSDIATSKMKVMIDLICLYQYFMDFKAYVT